MPDLGVDVDLSGASLLIGLILPYLVAILKQPGMPKQVVAVLTIVLSLTGGVVVSIITGQVDGKSLYENSVVVLSIASLFYATIGKALGVPETEKATNRELEDLEPISE
jgi:hypothetical protein